MNWYGPPNKLRLVASGNLQPSLSASNQSFSPVLFYQRAFKPAVCVSHPVSTPVDDTNVSKRASIARTVDTAKKRKMDEKPQSLASDALQNVD